MAFSSFTANLARASVGNDNAPTIWTYTTTDALEGGVQLGGYFNAASNRLKIGDLMYVWSSTAPTAGLAVVLANSRSLVPTFLAGVVHMSDFQSITVISSS
jgi:hypothetical protein